MILKLFRKRTAILNLEKLLKYNVEEIIQASRTRWKIENENNNTLKTKEYNFKHSYGHEKQHLSALLASLNILAFLTHTVLEWFNKCYQLLR